MKITLRKICVVVAVLAVVSSVLWMRQPQQTRFIVHNNAADTIDSVTLPTPDGTVEINAVAPGKSKTIERPALMLGDWKPTYTAVFAQGATANGGAGSILDSRDDAAVRSVSLTFEANRSIRVDYLLHD